MPCQDALGPSRKRQEPEGPPDQRPSKRSKLDQRSAYWDNLSRIWLTRDALEELDRRNRATTRSAYSHRSFTQQSQRHRYQTPALDCEPEVLGKIKSLSRHGGPDLSDLRNFPNLNSPHYQTMSTTSSGRLKRRAETAPESSNNHTKTAKTTSTSAYNRNFEQKLIDYGVYPDGYECPDGRVPAMPNNLDEINERLAQRRPSLSPSKFSESEFRKFKRADTNASKEKPVISTVIPTIDGDISDSKCVGGDYPFGNLAPLTDGTLAHAKPDHFFGARPEQLNPEIRDKLCKFIIPSTQTSLPMLPNFFLEAKGPDGLPIVATRQACYDGALGARGIYKLQSYKEKPIYDNNAYTITSTYQSGQLKIYTNHIAAPQDSNGRPEYVMTELNAWSVAGNIDSFRQGVSAYRNARDWAKEQRDRLIRAANERHMQAQSEPPSASEHEAISEPTVVLDDSTSATSNEAEFQDAVQWSFAQPNDKVEDLRVRAEPTDSNSRKSLPN
ncbi:hypothetical protein McanMca71_006708 [Microsporum canis]|uniref:Uncharacterized protein n=1 Tax=Arthroderma otae (strain ATCC MYA-4605 / CBS 113480) TaxID=554155 RepID=C5FFU2_ARTOC|nr:conserved hypothetical protein [Microsporum canis CBS 113480]EEQ29627.1 conserved hypothetical protein [Microsporum canis CBS 113480]